MTRLFTLIGFLTLTLSACSDGIDNSRLRVDIIEAEPNGFAIGKLPIPPASLYLRAATAQGLVTFDHEGKIIPALASRWIATDDGMSYIFRLKKLRWNDGREVTSDQVSGILNSRISELRKGRFGGELAVIDRSVSMTGKVIEIRLKAPMPNLLELLAQPEFGIIRNGVGSGPMLAGKAADAMRLKLRGLDGKGNPVLSSERIILNANKASIALTRFKAGQTDMVGSGRFNDLPALNAANIQQGPTQYDPAPGLFGLLFVEAGPFLSESSNREAIAMAIDRPKLLTSFGITYWQETVTLMPDNMQNRAEIAPPAWTRISVTQRQAQARQTILSWQASEGDVRPLRIALPSGPGGAIFFARIEADLAAIGLRAERVTPDESADLRLIDRVADMSSPSWYLTQLSCDATRVCDEEADAILSEARLARTAEERMRLLGEAETRLQATRNFIPLSNPLRWSVTRGGLLGYAPNSRALHLLQYLGRDPT